MIPTRATGSLPAAAPLALLAIAGLQLVAAAAWADEVSSEVKILRTPGAVQEGREHQFVVRLDERGVLEGTEGYGPAGTVLSKWEPETEFLWNFGDDSGVISSGERPSLIHRFRDTGTFTVQVEARSDAGSVFGSQSFKVGNVRPLDPKVSVVEIDAATANFELSVHAHKVAGDDVSILWEFGDGETREGTNLWRVTHRYPDPGTFEVTVSLTDADGGDPRTETATIYSLGPGPDTSGSGTAEGVTSGLEASLSGAFGADLRAEIRPVAGIFLGPIDGGDRCRFMLSAWDPRHLVTLLFLGDLRGLPEEGEGRYNLRPGNVKLLLSSTAMEFENKRHGILPAGLADRGIGELALGQARGRVDEILAGEDEQWDDDLQAEVEGRLGVLELGPREQLDLGAPSPTSPFSLYEGKEESFSAVGGGVELRLTPHERAVAVLDLRFANTSSRSLNQTVNLKGTFALDLAAAKRDGLFFYDLCKPASFNITQVTPDEDENNYVFDQRPRVVVGFDQPYDMETLDDSTFQLTYPNPGSGAPVPVDTEIHRRPSSAFLVPKKNLIGGLWYTARVKTGEDGVRGLNGAPLESDETGWHTWQFVPRLDFEAQAGQPQNLSCHIVQTITDSLLIEGKQAVARVYAEWEANPRAWEPSQIRSFPVRVALQQIQNNSWTEVASVNGRFSRESGGSRVLDLPFVPDGATPPVLRVVAEATEPNQGRYTAKYYTACSTPTWDHAPTLKINFHLIQSWEADAPGAATETEQQMSRFLEKIPTVGALAPYFFPIDKADIRFREALRLSTYDDPTLDSLFEEEGDWKEKLGDLLGVEGVDPDATEAFIEWLHCAPCLDRMERDAETSGADVAVGVLNFLSQPLVLELRPLVEGRPALVFIAFNFGRSDWAGPLLHQIAHALGLEADTPEIIPAFSNGVLEVHRSSERLDWHEGIRGGWFNEDDGRFVSYDSRQKKTVPLMSSAPGEDTQWILRHHYLALQRAVEEGALSE